MRNGLLALALITLSIQAFAHSTSDNLPQRKMHTSSAQAAVATGYLRVMPGQISGFSNNAEKERVLSSFPVIEAVINSEEFKNRVVGYPGSNGKGYTANNGLSNEAVYEFFMQGRELVDGDKNPGEMNFDLKRYNRSWSKVIGYTNPGRNNVISVNGKFYKNYGIADIASNLTHEWLHLNGFYHASASDHDSVPYAVGYIMNDLAEKFLKQGFLD